MSKKPPPNLPGTVQRSPLSGPGTRLSDKVATQEAHLRIDRDELVAKSSSPIKEVEAAKRYLERTCMTIAGEEYTTRSLSLTLLHLTQARGIGRDAIDGMRAVALILEGLQVEEEVRRQTARMEEITEAMEKKCVSLVDSVAMAMNQMLEEAEGKVREVVEAIAEVAQVPPKMPMTYAAVAAAAGEACLGTCYSIPRLTAQQAALLAREDAKAKQVLVDEQGGSTALSGLTEEEIVAKAMLAVEGMDAEEKAQIKVIGAKRLRNGGVILEMKTRGAAEMLKSEEIKEDFARNFGGNIKIKARSHSVVVEHVPVGFSPDINVELCKMESVNGLKSHSVLKARWIKPPHKRVPGQKVAHLIINVTSAESANAILRHGIVVAGKRVFGRKLVQEPRRCYKCQGIGVAHIAATCPQQEDTCGRCASSHKTSECQVDEPEQFRCANCNESGHAAGDRACPKLEDMRRRYAGNGNADKCRFFLVGEDSSTWEMTEGVAQEGSQGAEREGENVKQRGVMQGRAAKGEIRRSPSWAEEMESGEDGEGEGAGGEGVGTQTTLSKWI